MAHQLVIRGGAVVDGTGAAIRQADIAIDDGIISAVGKVAGRPDGGRRGIPGTALHEGIKWGWESIHTPSLTATRDELVGIAREIGAGSCGVLQAVADFVDVEAEFALLLDMVKASGRPLSISTMQTDARPDGWRRLLELITEAADGGFAMRGQVAPRAVGILMGLQSTTNPFARTAAYRQVAALPLTQKVAAWIVAGKVVLRDGEHTGQLPGKLIRGAQTSPTVAA